jgi:3',5'-cyclic-AMP phosphodiesterase
MVSRFRDGSRTGLTQALAIVVGVKLKTLAHLSDLHLGRSQETDERALRLRDAIITRELDHAIVTGDVTNRGRREELAQFHRLFGELVRERRVTVVPGNHDRLGDDVGPRLMQGGRVEVAQRDGLYLVRVDSTGSHNRFLLAGHGEICERVLDLIEVALDGAPPGSLVAVMLHHHPVPLPVETLPEWVITQLGVPWAAELRLGQALLQRLIGRCDLVLHGHRHVPRELVVAGSRPLRLFNAGCSTSLGRFRVFFHQRGALVGDPVWLEAETFNPMRMAEVWP